MLIRPLSVFIVACLIVSCSGRGKEYGSGDSSIKKLPDNLGCSIEIAPHDSVELIAVFRHDNPKKIIIATTIDTTVWNSAEITKRITKEIKNNSSQPLMVLVKAFITIKDTIDAPFKYIQLDNLSPLIKIVSFENVYRDKPNYTTSVDISLVIREE